MMNALFVAVAVAYILFVLAVAEKPKEK